MVKLDSVTRDVTEAETETWTLPLLRDLDHETETWAHGRHQEKSWRGYCGS